VRGSLSAPPARGPPGRRSRPVTAEEKFQAISTRRHGLGRDIALARHYLTNGGVSSLIAKVRSRSEHARAGRR
jgi:hypothetical protein